MSVPGNIPDESGTPHDIQQREVISDFEGHGNRAQVQPKEAPAGQDRTI